MYRERDQVLRQDEYHDSYINPPIRYDERDVIISNDSSALRIKSLEAQIGAMNEAFKLQEKILGDNGLALARFTISNRHDLFGRGEQPPLARMTLQSASGTSIGDHKGLFIGSSSRREKEKDIVEKFPYYLLLQSWRQQVIKCLMSKSFVDKELEIANRNTKSLRVEFLHEMQKMESNTLMWKQHGAAQAEKCELLSQQQSSLNEALLAEKKAHADTNATLQRARKEMGSLSSFLNHFKVQMDRQHVNEQARWMQYSQQLAEQQQRLILATERLSFISLFVAQKNVQLRNSIAALDGERRLIQWTMIRERERLEQEKTQARRLTAESLSSRDIDDGLGDSYSPVVVPFVSEVRMSAESEGMLKAVFRRLDVDDAGCVSIRLLLNAISGHSFQIPILNGSDSSTGQETASAFLNQLSAMKKEPSLLEQLVDGDLLSSLGVFLCRAIGLNQWANFLLSLLQTFLCSDLSDDPTVTWGECLLAMVADPADSKVAHAPIGQPGRYSALSVREMKEMRELQLIGDLEWGAVPLHVPSKYQQSLEVHRGSNPPSHAHTSVVEGGYSCMLDRDKQKEISRLSMERRFLLNSLQQMGRSLERRAESIKAYFEGDLRKHAVREKRLQVQLREAIEAKETMERRLQEVELSHSTSTEKLQRTLAMISEENGKLRDQLGEQRTDEERRMERLLQDAAAKQVRQETELGVLQRECAKKEVRAKALQRDLLRLQSQQANHADEVFSLKDQLAELQKQLRERDFELKSGLKSAEDVFNVEKLSFNQKINELQEQLISSRQQVQVLTDQLQEQERRHTSQKSLGKTESFTNTEEVLITANASQQAAAVRDQIDLIRNLHHHHQHQQPGQPAPDPVPVQTPVVRGRPQSDAPRTLPSSSPTPGAQQDILSAQLNKLLRLAEHALT